MPNMPETIDRHACRREPGRCVVLGIARFRRAGRGRPLRADHAQGAGVCRRLFLCRKADRHASARVRHCCRRAKYRARRRLRIHTGHGVRLPEFVAAVSYDAFIDAHPPAPIVYEQVPFDHPLFILYSSGTTGLPKCIVHGHGGTLLQHLKEHVLHTDVKPGDRLFYFTTCGWMMWNWLASGLASGATLLLYDGSPFVRDGRIMFEYARGRTYDAFRHLGEIHRRTGQDRTQTSGGVRPVERSVDPVDGQPARAGKLRLRVPRHQTDVCLSSISGGTDIVSCFALGNPVLPVGGERFSHAALALPWTCSTIMAARCEKRRANWSAPVRSRACLLGSGTIRVTSVTALHTSIGSPNIWCHGDFAEITAHDGVIIHGRSDAVLNPGGVRIGTAEIYRQVEKLPEVLESVVIGQDWPPGQEGDVRVVLFVKLRDDVGLDATLIDRIKRQIRENTTPRHVPALVLQVPDIPRTKSGKIVELAVRNVVHGRAVKNLEALANPEALEHFQNRAELGDVDKPVPQSNRPAT